MRPMCRFWAFLCAALFGLTASQAADSVAVDFGRDIVPIFEQHCIRCHKPGNEKGNLSLATSADLAANGYLAPGQPDESYLLEVVTAAEGQQPAMPKEGDPLSAEEISRLRSWIAAGANGRTAW